jgi:hypothetical protein
MHFYKITGTDRETPIETEIYLTHEEKKTNDDIVEIMENFLLRLYKEKKDDKDFDLSFVLSDEDEKLLLDELKGHGFKEISFEAKVFVDATKGETNVTNKELFELIEGKEE